MPWIPKYRNEKVDIKISANDAFLESQKIWKYWRARNWKGL